MTGRFGNLFALGRIAFVDESGPIAVAQVDQGAIGPGRPRLLDRLFRWAQFGFASVPPIGSDALVVGMGGRREQSMVLSTNHKESRPKGMRPGDCRLYDVRGAMIDLSADGMVIDAAGLPVTIRNYASLTAEGDLHVTGDVISRSGGEAVSLNALRDAYAEHAHTLVQPGKGTSGPTNAPA